MSETSRELAGLTLAVYQLVESQREATAMVNEHWEKLHRRNEEMDSFRCVELVDVRAKRDRLREALERLYRAADGIDPLGAADDWWDAIGAAREALGEKP